ncbi:glucosylglycerol hydrolase [Palleronia sp.]|uniref:glucosylglycerol hydrolase n=1 Tax=Palleronia sp. TaxID=1940284 RepID=UPI0035C7955A
MSLEDRVTADTDRAQGLAEQARKWLNTAETAFEAHQLIARTLGGQLDGDTAVFGFWTPELQDARIPDSDVFLEVLSPKEPLELTRSHQTLAFERVYLPVARYEAHTFAAAKGMRAGNRHEGGDFYALVWRDQYDEWHRILDPLAASLPFGAFAPAELYDLDRLQAERKDKDYWANLRGDNPHKFGPPTNILQIHVPTATAGGTLASLTRQFERLAERSRGDLPMDPMDEIYLGYDAVQLLPVEPTTVYEVGPDFWQEIPLEDGSVEVELIRPDTTNWGYDVVISGMATVNPVLLESGRPDELADLAAALHNFPNKPKMLVFDVVFGHSDNQGLDALNNHYFGGPNMYGQNLDYKNPAVRAILLELQRRKVDFGADGVRVDGAQDFKWWDPQEQELKHDNEYLNLMSDIVQNVAGTDYRPWFVFEDGRPWPQEDWELSSTYRAVIEQHADDDVFQWGPLTFAHNTPFIYGYWLSKWWRIKEMLDRGSNWISGTANHDTLRRGTQVNPKLNINTRLGDTRMEILEKAYDNPAVSMLTYAAFPGVPMDFLNATARANWGFIRNQDDKYGVKVVAEEAISLKWQVDDYQYSVPGNFERLKALGFETREELRRFFEFLPALVEVTEYDLDHIAKLLNGVEPPLAGPGVFTVEDLKGIARAWMDDMHDYCNVAHSQSGLNPSQTRFMLDLRRYRRANPWLRQNLGPEDHFDYMQPVDGRTVFTSYRKGPGKEVFTITHMEGGATDEFDPLRLPIEGLRGSGWRCVLRTPGIGEDYISGPITLVDSMGLVFERG